jgi:NAD(P)-dependent dehydrogenase (short-subunit alcohol dehydrogenase family)
MALPKKHSTKLGCETQMGINHFGHFYLTHLLWEHLKKSGNPRIINVSSSVQARGGEFDINFSDINYEKTKYDPFVAYFRSKKANILFTN